MRPLLRLHPLRLTLLLSALIGGLVTGQAHAWGYETHRMIASLAEPQLSPEAKAQVQRLLDLEPGSTLSSIATWADEIRDRKSAAWHYVNFDDADCTYKPERYCADGNCVIDAIAAQVKILKSSAPDPERLSALKFVVHLVADVHQPLHAGFGEDKGGNLFQVQAFGKGSNLHSLWDTSLIVNRPGGSASVREELAPTLQTQAKPIEPTPLAWAQESCKVVAQQDFYPDSRVVGEVYQAAHDATLKARLTAAAKRLAGTLNGVLR